MNGNDDKNGVTQEIEMKPLPKIESEADGDIKENGKELQNGDVTEEYHGLRRKLDFNDGQKKGIVIDSLKEKIRI